MPTLKYQGCSLFRQRIVASLLTSQPLKIENIRAKDDAPGLQDFEANFLRLIEKLTDGCHIEINETGTTLRFKPGLLQGSSAGSSTGTGKVVTHDCGTSRSIGWFIEGIIPIALFCKTPVDLVLTGVTNDCTDLSVDILRTVTLPLLQNFGVWGASLEVKRRGAMPKGGGIVHFKIPPVRTALKPLHVTEEGLVKRVRGVAFCAKISPTIVNRVIDSCRAVLNHVLPDVYINTDHYKGKMAGDSPGYSLSLVAETTTGVLLSVERTAASRVGGGVPGPGQAPAQGWTGGAVAGAGAGAGSGGAADLPEDVGRECAMMLLQEVYKGGVVDSMHQPLVLQLMVLTPEDVSKVRFGALTGQAVQVLRLLREAFGVTFRIKQETSTVAVGGKRAALPDSSDRVTGDGKRARRDAGSDGSDSDGEGSGGESGSEEGDSDNNDEEEDEEEEGSEGSDEEEDSEGSAGSEEGEDEGSAEGSEDDEEGSEEGARASKNGSSGAGSRLGAQTLERSTVLLSCYGVGYSNVYRKVT